MKNYLAVIFTVVIIISTSGCLWNEENEKKEKYVLEAVISVDKNIIYENNTITFNASSSKGDIVKYEWNFTGGNNWNAEGLEVTHRYSRAGHYRVKLKVVDVNEDHDYNTVDIYVNYKVEYNGNITKSEGEKSYFFPLGLSAQSAVVTLQYPSNYEDRPIMDKPNTNNLDLYIYYNESDDSEVKNSSTHLEPDATGTIEEVVELSRYDLLWNLTGMRASVKWAKDCLSDTGISYTLIIDVHYEPGYV